MLIQVSRNQLIGFNYFINSMFYDAASFSSNRMLQFEVLNLAIREPAAMTTRMDIQPVAGALEGYTSPLTCLYVSCRTLIKQNTKLVRRTDD